MVRERLVREGSIGGRILSSLLEGGKSGVKIGLDIIPGVLIICSVVMLLTFSEPPAAIPAAPTRAWPSFPGSVKSSALS